MAGYLNITQIPRATWIPSANPILFTIQTTNPYTRLSYCIDVIINGLTKTRLKYPVYDRKALIIDVQRIVNDYLTDKFVNDEVSFTVVSGETCSVIIKVTEEYWNGSQMYYDTQNAVLTKDIFVWRSAADFQSQRSVWTWYQNFDLMSTNVNDYDKYGKFLGVKNWTADAVFYTDLNLYPAPPKGREILFQNLYKVSPLTRRTMDFFITSKLTNASKHTQCWNVWCYNKQHNLTKRFAKKIHLANINDISYTKKIGCIPVGIQELNSQSWDQIVKTNPTYLNYIDPSEDKYYFVTVCQMNDVGNIIPKISSLLPNGNRWVGFEIVPCDRFKLYNILYKTAEGGWWQIRCNKKHFKETDVETNIKHNVWGQPAYTPLPNDARFKQVMHTQANGSITLNTDWIENQGIVDEIEEMIKSPSIYLVSEDATPVYIPVLLKDSTYQIYDKEQDRLFKYEFEFEEAFMQPALM